MNSNACPTDNASVGSLRSASMWHGGGIRSTFRFCYDGLEGTRHGSMLRSEGGRAIARAHGLCLPPFSKECQVRTWNDVKVAW